MLDLEDPPVLLVRLGACRSILFCLFRGIRLLLVPDTPYKTEHIVKTDSVAGLKILIRMTRMKMRTGSMRKMRRARRRRMRRMRMRE